MDVYDIYVCDEYIDKVNKYGQGFVALTERLAQRHKNPKTILRKLQIDKQFLNDFVNKHYHHFEKIFDQANSECESSEDGNETEVFISIPKKGAIQKIKKVPKEDISLSPKRQYSLISYDQNSGCLVERKKPDYTPYFNPPLRSAKNKLDFNELLDIVDHIRELQSTIDLLRSKNK